jgi:uncharacterized membrane protein YedE/YeeE
MREFMNKRLTYIASLLFLIISLWLALTISWRQAALFAIGGALGIVLYHAQFGFTSAYRVFISERRGAGIRAQMGMLALACLLFFPALSAGSLFDIPLRGNIEQIGLSLFVGSFLFGIGMQLGSGCASGTLYTVGGGSIRMIVTLCFFIAGSVLGTLHMEWWNTTPHIPGISILEQMGLMPALLFNLILFAGIVGVTIWLERRRHGELLSPESTYTKGWQRVLQGTWPLWAGALALAVLNFATLALAGKPWGITGAFALWGVKFLSVIGVDVASWSYWSTPARTAQLNGSLTADITTMMNVGIMIGALLAAALAGKFAPTWRVPLGSLFAAIIGGLLMGYGARLAYGCNIGAYFSGVASGSVHGWLWFLMALIGSYIGVLARPKFGLSRS